MSKAACVGDIAGGAISGSIQDFVTVDGIMWVDVGSPVSAHGNTPHDAPTMVEGSDFVTINGIPACINGNQASCGDAVEATGFVDISS